MSTSDSSTFTNQSDKLSQPPKLRQANDSAEPGRPEPSFELNLDSFEAFMQFVKQHEEKEDNWYSQCSSTSQASRSHLPPTYRESDVAALGMNHLGGQSSCQKTTNQSTSYPLAHGCTSRGDHLKPPMSTPCEPEPDLHMQLRSSSPLDPHEAVSTPPVATAETTPIHTDAAALPMKSMVVDNNTSLEGSEEKQIKNIEEALHCFWLVSEHRMSQMQQDIAGLRAGLDSANLQQETINAKLEQTLALHDRSFHQATRAAETSIIALYGIKALDRSISKAHEEIKRKIDEVQTRLKDGLETLIELAPKTRKPQARKGAVETTVEPKASKRPKPPSKKRTSSAASNETQDVQDDLNFVTLQPFDLPPTIASTERSEISPPSPHFSHASMEQERHFLQLPRQEKKIRLCHDQPQP